MFYQHGDVIIKPAAIPKGAKNRPDNHLAEGEVTGHYHGVYGDDVTVLELDGVRYLDAPSGASVTHQEHHKREIPPGQYEIGIVQEYDHFAQIKRDVQD